MDVLDPTTLDRPRILELQSRRLREMLAEIIPNNCFWKAKFDAAGVDPTTVQSVDDLPRLPLTTKTEIVADQQAHPPYGSNLTYAIARYNRLHQTSGTTGEPMRWLDTPASWDWLMRCWAQIYRIAGLLPEDRLGFPFSFGPFLGFWAAFEGAARLGNLCLPGGGMSSIARLKLFTQHDLTFICCTPTYALRLAEVAKTEGIDLAEGAVRAVLVAGEPGGNIPATRTSIEAAWGARVFDHWGMTEIGALAVESVETPGSLYLLETECIPEILDPKTEKPVNAGDEGELVVTNLGRWGSPLIRYRTGDRVRAAVNPPDAGLPMLCLEGGILGRTDEMITIRGNNLDPSKLENLVREFDEIVEYQIDVRMQNAMQHVTIEIELTPEYDFFKHIDRADDVMRIAQRLEQTVQDRLNFHAEVIPVARDALPRFESKGRRFRRSD